MDEEEPGLTPIESSRRYLLAEAEGFYGVWDRERPGDPVARFPADESGLDRAMREFNRLVRLERIARVGPVSLRWALFVGIAVWIVAGLLISIWGLASSGDPFFPGPFLGDPSVPLWVTIAQGAQDVAFRAWVGALAIIAALWLFDRGRQPT